MRRLDHLSPWAAAGLGLLLQPWPLVAAGAATIVQANVSNALEYLALLGFCLLSTATLLASELYATFRPVPAQVRLTAVRTWLETHRDQAIVVLALALGLWLTAKSLYGLVAAT